MLKSLPLDIPHVGALMPAIGFVRQPQSGQSVRVASDQFTRFLEFVRRVEDAHLSYHLTLIRPEAVCVEVYVPGEHWEVEFMQDGDVQVERFRSNGEIVDEQALDALFTDFAD